MEGGCIPDYKARTSRRSSELQNNYARIPFQGLPHILASFNEVSTAELNGEAGVAVAAFKRFEFMDDSGIVQEQELTSITSWIEVPRCVSITIALDIWST